MTGNPDLRNRKIIAVCCAGKPSEREKTLAYQVGCEIAKNGAIVVCGGLMGSMEAVAKGAKESGGTTIGIIPTTNRSDANAWIDIVIPTGLGHGRNNIVVATADGIIGVGGSWGTLSELSIAVKMGKPVAVLDGWKAESPYKGEGDFIVAKTPEEAVKAVLGE